MLHEIVYISRGIRLFSDDELKSLLTEARSFNESVNITGMLLYKDMSFLQLLEGEEKELRPLFGRIMEDSRHFQVKTLIDQPLQERAFSDWSMGFQNLTDSDLQNLPGFSEFMNPYYNVDEIAHFSRGAQELLYFFRHHS